ncbi:hypothetical protein NXC14_CH00086 [Rhizobium sp. NXC14]|nr:hypothetical protein NXC14_CH00086 [Rhizobium sp. NXC14]
MLAQITNWLQATSKAASLSSGVGQSMMPKALEVTATSCFQHSAPAGRPSKFGFYNFEPKAYEHNT